MGAVLLEFGRALFWGLLTLVTPHPPLLVTNPYPIRVRKMRRIFVRFFSGQQEQAERFAERLPEGELSMAKLQVLIDSCHCEGAREGVCARACGWGKIAS